MRPRLFTIFSIFFGLWATFATAAEPSTPVVKDDYGSQITLDKPFQRIVSLAPSITEDLFALGSEDLLVGVTSYCDFPPAARNKPKIGDIIQPNIERILSVKPDLILSVSNAREVVSKASDMKISCLSFRSESLADIRNDFQRLGLILGRKREAEALCSRLDKTIDEVTAKTQGRQPKKVLMAFDLSPLIAAGVGTLGNEILTLAGGDNIAAKAKGAYPTLSMEFVIEEKPEVILYAGKGTDQESQQLRSQWAQWSSIPAVAQGRIHSVSADLVSRSSPRIMDGLRIVSNLICGASAEVQDRRKE